MSNPKKITLIEFLKRSVGDRDAVLALANDCHEYANYLRTKLAERDAQLAEKQSFIGEAIAQFEDGNIDLAILTLKSARGDKSTSQATQDKGSSDGNVYHI